MTTVKDDAVLELVEGEIERCRQAARRIEVEIKMKQEVLEIAQRDLQSVQARVAELTLFVGSRAGSTP